MQFTKRSVARLLLHLCESDLEGMIGAANEDSDVSLEEGWETFTLFLGKAQHARRLNPLLPPIPTLPSEATWRASLQVLRGWWQDALLVPAEALVLTDTELRILKILHDQSPSALSARKAMPQTDLATAVQVDRKTIATHLKSLAGKKLVERSGRYSVVLTDLGSCLAEGI